MPDRSPQMTVRTKAGPVVGAMVRVPKRFPVGDTYEKISGVSPFGDWSAQMRDLNTTHIYTYPAGSPASNNAAIRRLVAKIEKWLGAWKP